MEPTPSANNPLGKASTNTTLLTINRVGRYAPQAELVLVLSTLLPFFTYPFPPPAAGTHQVRKHIPAVPSKSPP